MPDIEKSKCWFGVITDTVLAQAGGGGVPPGVDPRAADESIGDGRNRMNVNAPTRTVDTYGIAE